MKTKILKGLIAATLGFAMAFSVSIGIVSSNKRMNPVYAAVANVAGTDTINTTGFGGYTTNSFSAAGTDKTGVANGTNTTGVTYALQVFNGSTGAVRGNQSGWNNFSARNTTTQSGFYISKVKLTVSGGTIDGSTSGRSRVYFNNSAYSASGTPGGTEVAPSPASSGQSSLEWTNNDTNATYFVLYALKTAGTATSGVLEVTWVASGGGNTPPVETKYTVSYNANGGTGTIEDANSPYNSGTSVTVKGSEGLTAPEDMMFDKWNTAADGSGTNYNPGETFDISSNTTLYAQWKSAGEYFLEYSTGFESTEGFEASTTYNQTKDNQGPNNKQWKFFYGTASTSSAIDGSQSLQMRWYSSAPTNYPYAETKFSVQNIKKISFNYKVGNESLDFKTQYRSSTEEEWIDIETVNTTSTTVTNYTKVLDEVVSTFYFRILVCDGTAPTSSNYEFRVDNVIFKSVPIKNATINGENSVNVGEQWSPTSITEDESGDPVTGTTFAFAASDGAVIVSSNTATGTFTASASGTVTISATKGGYEIANKAVSVNVVITPTLILSSSSVNGYTGEEFEITATYSNLTSPFAWGNPSGTGSISGSVTDTTGNSTDGTSTFSGTLTGEGSVTLLATGGGVENKTVTFTITLSTVSISGLPSSGDVYVSNTLNLGSNISVSALGSCSNAVTWESSNSNIASVNNSGVVTGVAIGTADITVRSVSYPSAYMTCSVTVSRDDRWDTEFATTDVADIVLPDNEELTEDSYYVVAQITAITNATYGNGNAVDKDGTAFAIYGMYNFNGSIRYDAMASEEKPVVNDFVVLYGAFCEYKNAPEIKSARVVQRNGTVFHTEELTGISLNKSNLVLGIGEEFNLTVSPVPANAELENVTWESSNSQVVSVDNGVATGVATGSAIITATCGTFTATCNVTVSHKAILRYTDTENSVYANTFSSDADLTEALNLDGNLFNVSYQKNGASTEMYLVKNEGIRMYATKQSTKGNKFTVSISNDYTIRSINISFNDNSSATAEISYRSTIVNGVDGNYVINGNSFTIFNNNSSVNSNTQVKISSIEIIYEEASNSEKVSYLSTGSLLSYNDYTDNGDGTFSFERLGIRFVGKVDANLYDSLNAEGYGIFLAPASSLDGRTIESYYRAAKTNQNTVAEAIAVMFSAHGIRNYSNSHTIHEPEEKAIPTLIGNNYSWKLHYGIADNALTTSYVAVAYILVDGDIMHG